jgi:hypothetical protein
MNTDDKADFPRRHPRAGGGSMGVVSSVEMEQGSPAPSVFIRVNPWQKALTQGLR